MPAAEKVLITGGVAAVTVSLLLGLNLARLRQSRPLLEVHPWLAAHQTALLQGLMMLGLSVAVGLSSLSSGWESLAAWLIVVGATMSTLANLANASQRVQDQFAQRSLGLRLNTVQAILVLPGVVILLIGVLRGI